MGRLQISGTPRGWLATGELDAETCADFEQAVGALPEVTIEPIELDMAGVTFIDSSGLGVCLTLAKRLAESGRALAVANPSAPVTRLLRITSLAPVFGLPVDADAAALD